MLVGLMNLKNQSRLGPEISWSGRQGHFLIESRWTASHDMWLEGSQHSPKNLTIFDKIAYARALWLLAELEILTQENRHNGEVVVQKWRHLLKI